MYTSTGSSSYGKTISRVRKRSRSSAERKRLRTTSSTGYSLTVNQIDIIRQQQPWWWHLINWARELLTYEEYEDSDIDETENVVIRHKPQSLDYLCQKTLFTRQEIQFMYRGFKQSCPTGMVSLEQFREIYSQFFIHGDSKQYSTFIFNTFSHDQEGNITFEEFIDSLSILSRGSFDQKVEWIFNLYDLDNDGRLSTADMTKIIKSMYDLVGKLSVEFQNVDSNIQNHVHFILKRLGMTNKTISLEEFRETCHNVINLEPFINYVYLLLFAFRLNFNRADDELICQSLGLFDTVIK